MSILSLTLQPLKPAKKMMLCILLGAGALTGASFSTYAAVNVTDQNGVVYTIIPGTTDVRVSATNASVFKDRMTDIVIPQSVTDHSTTTLDSTTAYNVVSIDDSAFRGTSVTTVTIQAPVTEIPVSAFQDCVYLQSISFPASVTAVADNAFNGATVLSEVSDMTGVVTIGQSSFANCSGLQSITLHEGLVSIGESSFLNSGLTSIDFPSTMTELPSFALAECSSLTSVTFPPTMKRLCEHSLESCTSLHDVEFQEGMEIEAFTFRYCTDMDTIRFKKGMILDNSAFMASGMAAIEWPDEPMQIGTGVFSQIEKLTKVSIPSWMTEIPASTFTQPRVLAEVELHAGVRVIKASAFSYRLYSNTATTYRTSQLARIYFADGEENTLQTVEEEAFYNEVKLAEFPFADGQDIATKAFYNCGFTSLTLHAGMTLTESAFESNANITSITWPDQPLASIGKFPFGSLTKMTGVFTIPDWMETIPERLCYGWTAITSVTIPAGVSKISDYAFYNCNKIATLTLPETVIEIGASAFQNTFYTQSNYTLTLPSSLRTIGSSAFQACRFASVKFNAGIETIGAAAFQNSYITSVTWPSTLREIGSYAFAGTRIQSVSLANTQLTTIGAHAFEKSTSTYIISSVSFPETLEEIGTYAFYNHRINITAENYTFLPPSVKKIGDYAFSSTRYTSSTYFIRTIDLSNVEQLGAYAFQGVPSYFPILPEKPIELADGWFSSNTVIHQFKFPDWMTSVPDKMFMGATTLHKIDFNNITEIGESSFENCTSLATPYCYVCDKDSPYTDILVDYPREFATMTFSLPSTITKIGKRAFASTGTSNGAVYYYTNPATGSAQSATTDPQAFRLLVNSDIEIGEQAFYYANISEIQLEGCTDINARAFSGTSVKRLALPDCMTDIPDDLCNGMTDLEEIIFPQGVRSIGDRAFYSCKNLLLTNLPETITSIGTYAFSGCTAITDMQLPASLGSMGDFAFYNAGLTSIQWPDANFEMGNNCLTRTSLTSVNIPAYMTAIPAGTFSYCENLSHVTWEPRDGNPVTIGEQAFHQCYALINANLPDEVTALGAYCFSQCSSLPEINISTNITEIPDYCFFDCSNLTGDFPTHITSLGEASFQGTAYTDIIINDQITDIPNSCFAECHKMTTLTLGSAIKTIGEYAFNPCSLLTELTLPEGLETIGAYAFRNPLSIKRLELPSSLKEVGTEAFSASLGWISSYDYGTSPDDIAAQILEREGCPNLEEIVNHSPDATFSTSAFGSQYGLRRYIADYPPKEIGYEMFFSCINLTDIIFPEGTEIPVIWDRAFKNCFSLKQFNYPVIVHLGAEAFYDCHSLTNFNLPTATDYIIPDDAPSTWKNLADSRFDDEEGNHHSIYSFYYNYYGSKYNILNYCRNLQSVTIPYDAPYLSNFNLSIFSHSPLKGVSYCYAKGMVPNTYQLPQYYEMGYKPAATIARQYIYEDYSDEPILMVRRGEKWKYIDAGYNNRFNVIEMKEPKPVLDADIYSIFDPQQNINAYTVKLRWDLQLSDLNADGQTFTEILRDGTSIGTVTFSQPVEIDGQSVGLSTDKVIKVDISIDSPTLKAQYQGDYTYPVSINRNQYYSNELLTDNETLWILDYSRQDTDVLYFDATSGRRLNAYERYGYDSWLTLTDTFNSPALDTDIIPDHYTYNITMKGYDYQEYVNNDNYLPGDDDRYWHLETRSLPDLIISDDCTVRPNIGWLTVDFDGIYTTEQVTADTDAALSPSPSHKDGRQYLLDNRLDPDLVRQQVYVVEYDQTRNIITDFTTTALNPGQTILSIAPNLTIDRDLRIIDQQYDPRPMERYQTVVTTFSRGTFGSPVVTIPDTPTLSSSARYGYADHYNDNPDTHLFKSGKVSITLLPDVTTMGYTAPLPQNPDDYKIGVWYDHTAASIPMTLDLSDDNTGTLLYHWDTDLTDTPTCSTCAEEAHPDFLMTDTDSSTITYTHIFDDSDPAYINNYRSRLYVKIPSQMLRTDTDRWMMVTTPDTAATGTTTGIDDIFDTASGIEDSDTIWYDLNGIRVNHPQKGRVYIRVTPTSTTKTLIP